jgi:hypothetical protein
MNIQNLNPEEIKQLQILLNKMNPLHPTDVTYVFDPVNKMIDDIIENFDFDKVQSVMDHLNWRWVGEYVTVDMLIKEARRLLRGAAESRLGRYKNEHWEVPIIHGTGGFQASAFCDEDKTKIVALDLKFVLTEWDTEIED